MSSDDLRYYRERAAIERRCANESTNPHAREIHQKLADLYEKLLELKDEPSANQNVSGGTAAVA